MKKSLIMLLTASFLLTGCGDNNSQASTDKPKERSEILKEYIDLAKLAVRLDSTSKFKETNEYFTTIYNGTSYYMDDGITYDEAPNLKIPNSQLPAYNITVKDNVMTQHQTSLANKDETFSAEGDVSITQNPFALLDASKFIMLDDGSFNYQDLKTADEFMTRISGFGCNDSTLFNFKVNDNKTIDIKASVTSTGNTIVNYNILASDLGSAKIPGVVYQTMPYHKDLQEAFDNFNNTSYTLNVSDVSYFDYDEPVNYQIQKVDNIILKVEGKDLSGQAKRSDGVFDFVVGDDNNAYLRRPNSSQTDPFDFKPTLEVAPELFALNDDGSYSLINPRLAPLVSTVFGFEREIAFLGINAINYKLLVKNKQLVGVEFDSHIYDVEQPLLSHYKIDITNAGSTKLPSNINFDPVLTPYTPESLNVPTKYYGTYHGTCLEGTSFAGMTEIDIVISKDSLTVNDMSFPIISYSKSTGIEISVNNSRYYICDVSNNDDFTSLTFESADHITTLCLSFKKEGQVDPNDAVDVIPEAMTGTYKAHAQIGLFNGGKDFDIIITKNTVTVDGIIATKVDYLPGEEVIEFSISGVNYTIWNIYDQLSFSDADTYGNDLLAYNISKDSHNVIPMDVYGTYTANLASGTINDKNSVSIVIDENGITLNTLKATDITYTAKNDVITFKVNNVTYTLTNSEVNLVNYTLTSSDDVCKDLALNRTIKDIYANFKGNVVATFEDGKTLKGKEAVDISIGTDVMIDNVKCTTLSVTRFQLKVLYDDVVLYIAKGGQGRIEIYDKEMTIYSNSGSVLRIGDNFIGTWYADLNAPINGESLLTAVITREKITINGINATGIHMVKDSENDDLDSLKFYLDGKAYIFNELDFRSTDDDSVTSSFLGKKVSVPSDLAGTYKGTMKIGTFKGSNEISIILGADGSITVNGVSGRIYHSITNKAFYIAIEGEAYLLRFDKGEAKETIFRNLISESKPGHIESNSLTKQ